MRVINQISNFNYSEVNFIKKLMQDEVIFGQDGNGLLFSIILYILFFFITWGIWKNWPTLESTIHLGKIVIWSPIFRIIMMFYLTSCLWTVMYFNGLYIGGFGFSSHYDLDKPTVYGKGNNYRRLVGLDTRYPVEPEKDNYEEFVKACFTATILIIFPLFSSCWLRSEFEFLGDEATQIKFGTLYTDMNAYRLTA